MREPRHDMISDAIKIGSEAAARCKFVDRKSVHSCCTNFDWAARSTPPTDPSWPQVPTPASYITAPIPRP